MPFTQFPPIVTSRKTVVQYHSYDIDREAVRILDISSTGGSLGSAQPRGLPTFSVAPGNRYSVLCFHSLLFPECDMNESYSVEPFRRGTFFHSAEFSGDPSRLLYVTNGFFFFLAEQ